MWSQGIRTSNPRVLAKVWPGNRTRNGESYESISVKHGTSCHNRRCHGAIGGEASRFCFLFVNATRRDCATQFGGAEYNRAVKEGGSRQKAEALLDKRADRVESFHLQPLGPGDRARFLDSWRRVQARFVDGPGGAVTEADQVLRDVMSTRGYPVGDFEQRAADISVDHPLGSRSLPFCSRNRGSSYPGASRYGRAAASHDSLPHTF